MSSEPHLPARLVATGPLVEARPTSCPSCSAPWPMEPGHVVLGWRHCWCPTARHGGHRRYTCRRCGVEALREECSGASDDPSGWTR